MQFALRENRPAYGFWVLWVSVTLLCAVAGPFGSSEGMIFPQRLAYWGLVVGVSILGALAVQKVAKRGPIWQIGAWLIFVMSIATGVFVLNAVLFPDVDVPARRMAYLLTVVGVSVVVINVLVLLAKGWQQSGADLPQDVPEDPTEKFLRRVPLDQRGALLRIEAQDHYLNVITTKGSALVLMRLSEALEELAQARGLQTHRSHWVALEAVQAHNRRDGRDFLEMVDGTEVPVARARRDAAKEAGLF